MLTKRSQVSRKRETIFTMSQQKPCGYGSIMQWRGYIRANPEAYETFKREHKETKKRMEEHYQQRNPMDLEDRIERGYN